MVAQRGRAARHHRPAAAVLAGVAVGGVSRDGPAELRNPSDTKESAERNVVLLGEEALRLDGQRHDGVARQPEDVCKLEAVDRLRGGRRGGRGSKMRCLGKVTTQV